MAIEERRSRRTLAERLSVSIPLVIMWTIGCAIMAIVASQPATRASELLMDPTFTLGAKWYTGLISNLGILTWTVGAAAAFFGAWLCELGGRGRARRFLTAGGLVGVLLLLDDLFMFHAVLLPAEIGLPKTVGQTLIGVAVVFWFVSQRNEIRRTHFYLLGASSLGLVASYAIDTVFAPLPGDGWNIVEDGAKFLGVLAWATYFVVTTRDISRSVFVDALLTWPDAAYQKVYEQLETEGKAPSKDNGAAAPAPAPAAPAPAANAPVNAPAVNAPAVNAPVNAPVNGSVAGGPVVPGAPGAAPIRRPASVGGQIPAPEGARRPAAPTASPGSPVGPAQAVAPTPGPAAAQAPLSAQAAETAKPGRSSLFINRSGSDQPF